MLLAQEAQARAHAPGHRLLAQALTGRNGQGMPATREEAPGLLAEVAQHLGAQHAPDLFPVQHALSQAVSAPRAATHRAAAQAVAQAAARRTRVQERLDQANGAPASMVRSSPRAPASLDRGAGRGSGRHEPQRLAGWRRLPRASVPSARRSCVDLERGVRRHGDGLEISPASRRPHHGPHAPAARPLWAHRASARVGPTMRAPMRASRGLGASRCVNWPPPRPPPCMPRSFPLALRARRLDADEDRRPPLRARAERLHTPGAPGGAFGACSVVRQTSAKQRRPSSRRSSSAPAPMWKGATGTAHGAITSGEGSTLPESVRA
jgi:hypothetical protein